MSESSYDPIVPQLADAVQCGDLARVWLLESRLELVGMNMEGTATNIGRCTMPYCGATPQWFDS